MNVACSAPKRSAKLAAASSAKCALHMRRVMAAISNSSGSISAYLDSPKSDHSGLDRHTAFVVLHTVHRPRRCIDRPVHGDSRRRVDTNKERLLAPSQGRTYMCMYM